MRLVVDTNVLVSGLLWSGGPSQLLQTAESRSDVLVTSQAMLSEFDRVLGYGKFKKQLAKTGLSATALVERYILSALIVVPAEVGRVAPDPEDDMVLAAAQAGRADLIVSGDAALLSLGSFGSARLVTVRDALARLQDG